MSVKDRAWSFREVGLILMQAGLLLVDSVVLLPLLPLLYCTQVFEVAIGS